MFLIHITINLFLSTLYYSRSSTFFFNSKKKKEYFLGNKKGTQLNNKKKSQDDRGTAILESNQSKLEQEVRGFLKTVFQNE